MERKRELKADPSKTEAWLRRGAKAYADKVRATPRPRAVSQRRRRNDSAWRDQVMRLRGQSCRSCGGRADVQADHVIPRSQGGPSVVENGMPLCGDFGRERCHPRKTDHQLLIQRDWLDWDQVVWLRESGHAWWEQDGTVSGRHCRLFAPIEKG